MNGYYIAPDIRFSEDSLANLNRVMTAFGKYLGRTVEEQARETSIGIATQCAMESPPFVKKSANNTKTAEAKGLNTLRRDILRAVTPVDALVGEKFKNKSLSRYIRTKNYTKFREAIDRMPRFSSWKVLPFDSTLHTSVRGRGIYKVKDIHRVTTLDLAKFRRYMKEMESRVGYLKAGWMKTVANLGGPVPVWLKRNLLGAKGDCKINKSADGEIVSILIENWTPTVDKYSARYNYAIDWLAERHEKSLRTKIAHDVKKAAALNTQ